MHAGRLPSPENEKGVMAPLAFAWIPSGFIRGGQEWSWRGDGRLGLRFLVLGRSRRWSTGQATSAI